MGFKDIVVHLDNGAAQTERLTVACELARREGAHLVGIFVLEPVPFTGYGIPVGDGAFNFEELRLTQERLRTMATSAAEQAETALRTSSNMPAE